MSKGNIYIKNENGGIYLYTAKDGSRLPKILKKALIRGRGKWGDTASLTRVIFSEMTQNEPLSLNGYGISTQLTDNEEFILVVDDRKEKVGIFGESGRMYTSLSFESLVDRPDLNLEWNRIVGSIFSDDYGTPNPANPYPMP